MSADKDKTMLFGISGASADEHKRITKGDNFCLYGGDERRHDMMVEEVLLFNEILKTTGRTLDQLSRKEYYTIVREVKSRKRLKSSWLYGKDFLN